MWLEVKFPSSGCAEFPHSGSLHHQSNAGGAATRGVLWAGGKHALKEPSVPVISVRKGE